MKSNIQITLTKASGENDIKTYFQKVLELKQSGEEFPVNLEPVWPLVYSEKGKAVRALTLEFIENVDYQVLAQNGKNLSGGRPVENYYLSVSCMEYFIARKVRPVFDVYRKVFHRVTEQKPLSTLDLLELAIKGMRENQQELQEVKKEVLELKAKTQTRPDYFTIVGYGTLHHVPVNLKQASSIGKMASAICRMHGFPIDKTTDPRFGIVNMYPVQVLDEAFKHLS
jgi:hypothetical protein